MTTAFIEKQFPVSKVSKESYKERKANNGQTLTGLGKWWGRKPLILCRATILGCLMPASDNPARDNEIFLKILSMDEEGLWLRKEAAKKSLAAKWLRDMLMPHAALWAKYGGFFTVENDDEGNEKKVALAKDAPRAEIERAAFDLLGYDEKIALGVRPEHFAVTSEQTWREINHHLGTSAASLPELVEQLAQKRFGHSLRVGDCFCGGGSIPFEAARIGCAAYGSDLNPVAGLLTWAAINVCGASKEELEDIRRFQQSVYDAVDAEIRELGIESRDNGDRAVSYLYCVEAKCPECGKIVPMAPSWVIGKGTKTIVEWTENDRGGYDPQVKMHATPDEMAAAEKAGTATSRGLTCPHCQRTTPISTLRRDRTDQSGEVAYGLRRWEKHEFEPRPDDVFHERLYAVKYEHREVLPNGKVKATRYYRAPDARELANEKKVHDIVAANFAQWQADGLVPSMAIEAGYNTDQLIRERGWTYWHQLFNCRQLLTLKMFAERIGGGDVFNAESQSCREDSLSPRLCASALNSTESKANLVAGILGLNKLANWNSMLCRWINDGANEKGSETYYNQALNTLCNYPSRTMESITPAWFYNISEANCSQSSNVVLADARLVDEDCDFWITDPPYADAVNYHELSEFFLAWDKSLLKKAFPEWYADSKRALAVRGFFFNETATTEIYTNLAKHSCGRRVSR